MEGLNKEGYDKIPVFYCKHCLSLRIRDAGIADLLYCDECSSTDIEQTDIHDWDEMYVKKYGFHFINK